MWFKNKFSWWWYLNWKNKFVFNFLVLREIRDKIGDVYFLAHFWEYVYCLSWRLHAVKRVLKNLFDKFFILKWEYLPSFIKMV